MRSVVCASNNTQKDLINVHVYIEPLRYSYLVITSRQTSACPNWSILFKFYEFKAQLNIGSIRFHGSLYIDNENES